MRFNFDSGSKVTDASWRQPAKHSSQIASTEEGMQTDNRAEHSRNALLSIRVNREPSLKLNDKSESQSPKHSVPIISIARFNLTCEIEPKYRRAEIPSKSSRKPPEERRWEFPSSTVTLEGLAARAE
jgi:hypothetical protein